MGMREKLIEILRVPIYPHELADPTEAVADYLLDNDVVPVVRCKDCKHCIYISYACGDVRCGKLHTDYIKEGDFCSYGERKDDGN